MNAIQYEKDIVFLVADKNIKFSINGILLRHDSLEIPQLKTDIFIHPGNDSGCLHGSHDFLRTLINRYAYSMVVFDREGCGQEDNSRQAIETQVEDLLSRNGWNGRNSVIVIDPELENWVWSDSPHVEDKLGWRGKEPDLRTWLIERGLLLNRNSKPTKPKEAMQLALKEARMPRSSSIYQQLAERVGFRRCNDSAFIKLKTTIREWFPLA
ncbi:MAG: hypothetical protein FJ128_05295 [Deltaproteobacteria bacterium]|nr:hypothetical protein [Deltaproteobacteria bacterium]